MKFSSPAVGRVRTSAHSKATRGSSTFFLAAAMARRSMSIRRKDVTAGDRSATSDRAPKPQPRSAPAPFIGGMTPASRAVPGSTRSQAKTPGCDQASSPATCCMPPAAMAASSPSIVSGRVTMQRRWCALAVSPNSRPKSFSSLPRREPPLLLCAITSSRPPTFSARSAIARV
ncbi:hypothetical protein D3C72_1786670 [compost metagenome]